MPSFFDLMKYAQTGIASPDMTHYDKMRARAMAGGYPMRTIEGVPPLTFRSDGKPLISWSMKGNGSQQGTPTPDNPVMPEFVGVKTANLFDGSGIATSANGVYVDSVGQMLYFHGTASGSGGRLNPLSNDITLDAGTYRIRAFGQKSIQLFLQKKGDNTKYYRFDNTTSAISLVEQTTFFISCGVIGDTRYDETVGIVLVSGSTTPTSYIPYGWQIPITCAGHITPVYLGEVPTVRRVRKYALTGAEPLAFYSSGATGIGFYLGIATMMINMRKNGYCTHFQPQLTPSGSTIDGVTFGANSNQIYFTFSAASVTAYNLTDITSIKAWLAQQHANGTPVTVWYVLATPETATVNEPLRKIGTYADELHSTDAGIIIQTAKGENVLTVDTDLQPSKVSITGTIKE